MIDVLVKTCGEGLQPVGREAQSFQSTARAGWRAVSLAVLRFLVSSFRPSGDDKLRRTVIGRASGRPVTPAGHRLGHVGVHGDGDEAIEPRRRPAPGRLLTA